MTKGWLIGGGVFLGALLIASVIVAMLDRDEPLPEGSPEAAVQSFLKAIEDENFEVAHSSLSDSLREDCPIEKFAGGNIRGDSKLRDNRITLERTKTVQDTVFVTVRVTQFHGSGPFGASESSFEHRFALRQEEGRWRFTEFPWPFFRCGPFEPVRVKPAAPPTPEPTPIPEPTS